MTISKIALRQECLLAILTRKRNTQFDLLPDQIIRDRLLVNPPLPENTHSMGKGAVGVFLHYNVNSREIPDYLLKNGQEIIGSAETEPADPAVISYVFDYFFWCRQKNVSTRDVKNEL